MRRILTIIIFFLVFAIGIGFSAINNNAVSINYYLGTFSLPLSIVIVISIVLGLLIGALTIFLRTIHLRYENRRLNKRLSELEKEIDNLRIIPITDEN